MSKNVSFENITFPFKNLTSRSMLTPSGRMDAGWKPVGDAWNNALGTPQPRERQNAVATTNSTGWSGCWQDTVTRSLGADSVKRSTFPTPRVVLIAILIPNICERFVNLLLRVLFSSYPSHLTPPPQSLPVAIMTPAAARHGPNSPYGPARLPHRICVKERHKIIRTLRYAHYSCRCRSMRWDNYLWCCCCCSHPDPKNILRPTECLCCSFVFVVGYVWY